MKKCFVLILVIFVTLNMFIFAVATEDTPNKAQETINHIVERARDLTGKTTDSDDDSESVDSQNREDVEADDFDYAILADYFARQEEYKTAFIQSAEDRISEYWNVELIGIDVILDDTYIYDESEKDHIQDHIYVMNVDLRWNVDNSAEKTRNRLSAYSDDMAITLHSVFPDIPIDQMRIVWEVPSILKSGYAAKYQYYSVGDDMYCSDRYGVLYGRM